MHQASAASHTGRKRDADADADTAVEGDRKKKSRTIGMRINLVGSGSE